uniref:CASP-like protein n=1 Tax=Setaria digitata TaxID=48799 RepID=A0A915PPR7_9BILA
MSTAEGNSTQGRSTALHLTRKIMKMGGYTKRVLEELEEQRVSTAIGFLVLLAVLGVIDSRFIRSRPCYSSSCLPFEYRPDPATMSRSFGLAVLYLGTAIPLQLECIVNGVSGKRDMTLRELLVLFPDR